LQHPPIVQQGELTDVQTWLRRSASDVGVSVRRQQLADSTVRLADNTYAGSQHRRAIERRVVAARM
jgi:hypothetical protein